MLQGLFTDPAWIAVILATLAIIPQVVSLIRWAWRRWRAPYEPKTQIQADRAAYDSLLRQYDAYLNFLESLVVMRAQHEAGPDEWTPELWAGLVEHRDQIYENLENRGNKEEEMGIFQKLDILEGRTASLGERGRDVLSWKRDKPR